MSAQSEALRLAIFCLEVKLDKRSPMIIIIDMMNLLWLEVVVWCAATSYLSHQERQRLQH